MSDFRLLIYDCQLLTSDFLLLVSEFLINSYFQFVKKPGVRSRARRKNLEVRNKMSEVRGAKYRVTR